MAAPPNEFAFDLEAALAAALRRARRTDHYRKFEEAVREKRFSALDTPKRCIARANRLLEKLRDAVPSVAETITESFAGWGGEERATATVTEANYSDALLERVIGKTRDFQFVEFLESALYAGKSVGRIVTRLGGGRYSYGTGFMVTPRLLLTNHHVLPSDEAASQSSIEFDYQRDRLGRELTVRSFALDPGAFFLNDKDLDFALTAVKVNVAPPPLRDYRWLPLFPDPGKIVVGDSINIIQHPKGERKQVVIRSNRLLDAFDGAENFYHYEADTEPGSSGSPVFNDQWEVVALHHSGVPKRNAAGDLLDVDGHVWKQGMDPTRLVWVANEGVRISKIIAFVSAWKASSAEKPFLQELLDPKPCTDEIDMPRTPSHPGRLDARMAAPKSSAPPPAPTIDARTADGAETFTIPLKITVSLGRPETSGTSAAAAHVDSGAGELLERIDIDPDYTTRQGYEEDFLGFAAPFPKLNAALRKSAFALPGKKGDARYRLDYHHYSLIFNADRKLAFVSGVNYDPTAEYHHKRDQKDEWFYDERMAGDLQAGESLYADNPLDRGHLVRRADAGWGATPELAKLANDDTFHFTNCSPQHALTNQGKSKIKDRGKIVVAPPGLKLWGKLEDHLAAQGKSGQRKLCIFNGPVFRKDDEPYRGIRIPREYWKVVVFADDAGRPAAAAFVLSQAELIADLKEEFQVGEYQSVQISVAELEKRTGLNFGKFTDWDVLEREGADESFRGEISAVVLNSLSDVRL